MPLRQNWSSGRSYWREFRYTSYGLKSSTPKRIIASVDTIELVALLASVLASVFTVLDYLYKFGSHLFKKSFLVTDTARR
jgi:predicted anti-sigma-YlaC factor YlaD